MQEKIQEKINVEKIDISFLGGVTGIATYLLPQIFKAGDRFKIAGKNYEIIEIVHETETEEEEFICYTW